MRAEPAETGRAGYDPRDLLKLYWYGYLQQVGSSRRLEAECQRNVEVMWLLGGLQPDYKSMAEFRRMHSQAVTEAGAEWVRFARSVGVVRGETVAVDGSKFRAVSSAKSVREREAVKRYLEQLDAADEQDELVIDANAVQAGLEKLKNDPEPEARFICADRARRTTCRPPSMRNTLIVAHKVSDQAGDNSLLLPRAEAAKQALGGPESLPVVADAGYSNGEQAEACEAKGIVPPVPVTRSVNNQGDGTLFDRSEFYYDEKTDTFRCPARQTLARKQAVPQRSCCLLGSQARGLRRLCAEVAVHESPATFGLAPSARRCVPAYAAASDSGEDATATLNGRASLRFAQVPDLWTPAVPAARPCRSTEISLAAMVYNLKRMLNVLGGTRLRAALLS